MSLSFTAATTNRVAYGTALGNWTAGSWVFWYYPTTLASFVSIVQLYGSSAVPSIIGGVTTSELRMVWRRGAGGSNMTYETNNASITTNKWWYVGATVDQSAGAGVKVKFYVGDLSTLAVLKTNGTTTDVSSGYVTNNGATFYVGDNATDVTPQVMRFACVQFFPSIVLTLAEIQALQFRFGPWRTGVKLFSHLGFNGTGTQPDWSGNGNAGTVTGAAVAPHVPLRPFFGADQHLDLNVIAAAAAQRQRFLNLNQAVKRAAYW